MEKWYEYKYEKRLKRIEVVIGNKKREICDMTYDELTWIITGNPNAIASDIIDEELKAIVAGVE
jgi:hypothetical protein